MKLGKVEHKTPETPCPYCGNVLDGATGVDYEDPPYEGCWSICTYCGGLLVYDADLHQVEPSAEVLAEMIASPAVKLTQRGIHLLLAQEHKENP